MLPVWRARSWHTSSPAQHRGRFACTLLLVNLQLARTHPNALPLPRCTCIHHLHTTATTHHPKYTHPAGASHHALMVIQSASSSLHNSGRIPAPPSSPRPSSPNSHRLFTHRSTRLRTPRVSNGFDILSGSGYMFNGLLQVGLTPALSFCSHVCTCGCVGGLWSACVRRGTCRCVLHAIWFLPITFACLCGRCVHQQYTGPCSLMPFNFTMFTVIWRGNELGMT